jgi:cyclophilin family peptidyl-prolyl cis-trans isomerase/HEAT repeat protein
MAGDVLLLRAGAHSSDPQIARTAVRALGRLERPALIQDITFSLKSEYPEVRAEAATAVAQALQGWKPGGPLAGPLTLDAVAATLESQLRSETDANVREQLCESIGRLPYGAAPQVARAESLLVERAASGTSLADRLGVAKGLFWLARKSQKIHPLDEAAIAVLRQLAVRTGTELVGGARVRRLALDALIRANGVDDGLLKIVAADSDVQVRRLAMHAAASGRTAEALVLDALADEAGSVRIEALRTLGARKSAEGCVAFNAATGDREIPVALVAIDQLGACQSREAVSVLKRTAQDVSKTDAPRRWQRAAHAIVALAHSDPDRARAALPPFARAATWQLRMYGARAAALINDRGVLELLAGDQDDNVREAAVEGLATVAGHAADPVYVSQFDRGGYQVLRAAAIALKDTPAPERAVPPLKRALARLIAEGRDNSRDARDAIVGTLTSLHAAPASAKVAVRKPIPPMTAEQLRLVAGLRARLTIRGVGSVDLALLGLEAPYSVLRFEELAAVGYYNGLTFHRVVPNFVIQGGSPGANEYIGDAAFMRDELGQWPHVRGSIGISTRGRDTGDAQIFIDLVDNPVLDHEFTVFAQVLNGLDLIDQILEGDTIERIEIVR